MPGRLFFHPSKELIEVLYDEGKTCRELAEIFAASDRTVRRWMDRYAIPRRETKFTLRNRVGERNWFPRNSHSYINLAEPSFNEDGLPARYSLQYFYIDLRMSPWQIGEHYDRLESDVLQWLDYYQLYRPMSHYRRPINDDYRRARACIIDIPIGRTRLGELDLRPWFLLECGHRIPLRDATQDMKYFCAHCRKFYEGR